MTDEFDEEVAGLSAAQLSALASEQLLIGLLPDVAGERVLCTSLGRAQLARAATAAGRREVTCWFLDQYRAALASEAVVQDTSAAGASALKIICNADFPTGEVDVVAIPTSSGGEADLARELIQQGHERLAVGGRLLTSTDNRRDRWLGEELGKRFDAVRRHELPLGTAYVATKSGPLRKLKNHACEFAFRDRGHLIRAYSRPGVFAHRRIDPGARQLLAQMDVRPGQRVIDIGCGSGTVALAAALRATGVTVHAVDSNARAVECTLRGAARNQLTNVTAELNAHGPYQGVGAYDMALANPPYYASFRIAEHFLRAAHESLRSGGRVWVVTKTPDWYAEQMPRWFDDVKIVESKSYYVASGTR
ncbi:MAG: methyltransferase [Planctomycetes bacterium]|nr:methyltransferase [Planctomycetota bacterium]